MELKCVSKPWSRDRAKVHGVTALQRLSRRIRSMKVPPEDTVNPSGGKDAKICERYGETALTPVLHVTACLGFFSASVTVSRIVLHIDSAVYGDCCSVGCSN
jgi:hypothetical protein